jgi:hypothetical protein
MLLVYKDDKAKEIGVAFVDDNEAEVLEAVGYYHCNNKDYMEEEPNGRYVEVWKACE